MLYTETGVQVLQGGMVFYLGRALAKRLHGQGLDASGVQQFGTVPACRDLVSAVTSDSPCFVGFLGAIIV
jgi:hypothetical protein